jgi:molybdopterin molybdotransferase
VSGAAAPRLRLGVAEAIEAVLDGAVALDAERVALGDALGRVLAADVVSSVALPPWDNAGMDGIAVRAADVRGARADAPIALRLTGAVTAGSAWRGVLAAGEAVRIATGAPVPAGADAVVRVEDVTIDGAVVHVHDDRDVRDDTRGARRNVRPRGEDVAEGARAVAAGTRLGAAALGVLASVGDASALVVRRPRVGIVSSGDELLPLGDVDGVRAGRGVVSSNAVVLSALVREAGGEPLDLGVARDEPAAMQDRLRAAMDADCDVVLTTGGVSVGERDLARDTVLAVGGTLRFWRVRMRPGGPLAYGTLPTRTRHVPWLGLPGNPVSTVVTFTLFARPLLRRLAGDARPFRRAAPVTLTHAFSTHAPLTQFLRAQLDSMPDGALGARLTGPQGSGLLTSAARADALVVVPEGVRTLDAGATVRALLLGEGALDAATLDASIFGPVVAS